MSITEGPRDRIGIKKSRDDGTVGIRSKSLSLGVQGLIIGSIRSCTKRTLDAVNKLTRSKVEKGVGHVQPSKPL